MIYPDHTPDDHVCALCPRPRDAQRSRLYKAEAAALEASGRGDEYATIVAMERIANQVLASSWWRDRFQYVHPVTVIASRRAEDDLVISYAEPGMGTLAFHRDMRSAAHLAHEMAHLAQPYRSAWHGPEFAAAYLVIARHLAGPDVARALHDAFRDHGVRVAPLEEIA